MEFILNILYVYVAIYSFYFLALALRNFSDKRFRTEFRYAQHEVKNNFAVVIYAHNNKSSLERLIAELKMQDYPVNNFRVFVILDNCNDGSEQIFEKESFINVINIKDVGTVGKDQAVSMLLERLSKDNTIDSYIFLDGNRNIPANFLASANAGLIRNNVLSGEAIILSETLGPVDKIKAAYQKYQMNFIAKARSLFGLAVNVDSGLLIIKKDIVDNIGIDFKDINSELKYSLLLSKVENRCIYNPNIQTLAEGYEFRKPRLTCRLELFKNCFTQIWSKNFVFAEHTFSLLNPNFWTLMLVYAVVLKHSYRYYFFVDFRIVLFTFIVLLAGFGISLINAKMNIIEIVKLCLYPIYSICHIVKNLPPVRLVKDKVCAKKGDIDKLVIDAFVMNIAGRELPCKVEFISQNDMARIKFMYKNKKFITGKHLRMIDALQEIRQKLFDYGFVLKICSCCKYFKSDIDGSTNMLKGFCCSDYPSPSLNGEKPTLIWNSCSDFEPSRVTNIVEEIAQEIEE